jgi:transcriptional regulator with XRE-family HTH domain
MATDYEEKNELQELNSLKNINVSAFETQQMAIQMAKDGFTSEQIAEALGYSVKAINNFTQMQVEVGSPEEVLQEGLRTVLSLIPIAEAQYRERPAATYAYTLTGFIESARSLIAQAYTLKSKEDVYRSVLAKVFQPLCREMIKSMLGEVGVLNSNGGNGISESDLKTFSTNLGKKFQECYRKSTEDLGTVLGVSPDARARILSGSNEPVD